MVAGVASADIATDAVDLRSTIPWSISGLHRSHRVAARGMQGLVDVQLSGELVGACNDQPCTHECRNTRVLNYHKQCLGQHSFASSSISKVMAEQFLTSVGYHSSWYRWNGHIKVTKCAQITQTWHLRTTQSNSAQHFQTDYKTSGV